MWTLSALAGLAVGFLLLLGIGPLKREQDGSLAILGTILICGSAIALFAIYR